MIQLEQNYLSVVALINNGDTISSIQKALDKLHYTLSQHFKSYEIILVNNATEAMDFQHLHSTYIMIDLFTKENQQAALTAGIDMAIGDYVIEIPYLMEEIDFQMILQLYHKSQENHDFVFLTTRNNSLTSKVFYGLLNRHFKKKIQSEISSSIMTLSSRRGLNRIAELGSNVINRNLAYSLSGLKTASISTEIRYKNRRSFSENITSSIDTLLYYTTIVMTFLQRLSMTFFAISILGVVYSILLRLTRDVIEGWSSLFVLISFGFAGLFFILSIISRYLFHILHGTNHSKSYVFRDIIRKTD